MIDWLFLSGRDAILVADEVSFGGMQGLARLTRVVHTMDRVINVEQSMVSVVSDDVLTYRKLLMTSSSFIYSLRFTVRCLGQVR